MPEEQSRDELLTWFVRLSDEQPKKVAVIALSAAGVGAIGLFLFRQPVVAGLGMAMVAGSTAEFWLGTHYRLDAKTVSSRCGFSTTSMEWSDVKRVVVNGDFIRVSPLENLTRMEPFRGVQLRTLPQDRLTVLQFVRAHCKEDVRVLGAGDSGRGSGNLDPEGSGSDSAPETGNAGDLRD